MKYPKANIIPLDHPKDKPLYALKERFLSHKDHDSIYVLKGFKYDGASVPRLVWTIFGMLPDGENREASLVHDWLYVNDGDLSKYGHRIYTRKEADKLFKQMLIDYGVRPLKAKVAYTMVRLFGGKVWSEGNGEPTIIDL